VLLDSAGRRIICVALAPDGRLIVTGDGRGGVCAWAAASSTLLRRFSDRTGSVIYSVALTEMPRVRSGDVTAGDGDDVGTCLMTPAQPCYVASRDAGRRC
jgi:hypothetical protein